MKTSTIYHRELRAYYSQFRGFPAPVNSHTEALWKRIEDAEAAENE